MEAFAVIPERGTSGRCAAGESGKHEERKESAGKASLAPMGTAREINSQPRPAGVLGQHVSPIRPGGGISRAYSQAGSEQTEQRPLRRG